MNNILPEIEELKELIIDSEEYKEYNIYLKKVENNKEINNLIKSITTKQKELVRNTSLKNNTSNLEKELDDLYNELYSYSDYNNYIKSSKRLNILISKVQNNFQEYFNSLIS